MVTRERVAARGCLFVSWKPSARLTVGSPCCSRLAASAHQTSNRSLTQQRSWDSPVVRLCPRNSAMVTDSTNMPHPASHLAVFICTVHRHLPTVTRVRRALHLKPAATSQRRARHGTCAWHECVHIVTPVLCLWSLSLSVCRRKGYLFWLSHLVTQLSQPKESR